MFKLISFQFFLIFSPFLTYLIRSIAVWDYSESKFWHPELSGSIKRFVPSQITTPTFDNKENTDFGRCISIRGLPIAADTELLNGYNPKQVCAFHHCISITISISIEVSNIFQRIFLLI